MPLPDTEAAGWLEVAEGEGAEGLRPLPRLAGRKAAAAAAVAAATWSALEEAAAPIEAPGCCN